MTSTTEQAPPLSATVISAANFKSLIGATVRDELAKLLPNTQVSDSRNSTSPAPSAVHPADRPSDSDSGGSTSGLLSSKGPTFTKSGFKDQYDDLKSVLKALDDALVVLDRGLDPQVAINSVKTAKLLLEKRMSMVILADRMGSWAAVEKVCDNTASFVTDPAVKKALETWNSVQGWQLSCVAGATGPTRRSADRPAGRAQSTRRSRSRSRSPPSRSPRAPTFERRSLLSSSFKRPAGVDDDYCYKCGGFGHWANKCSSAVTGSGGRSQFTGRSGFASSRR